MTAQPAHVTNVDEASFQREVIDRSRTVPVVVDFWAPWCGPCRMLGPVLERLAAEGGGDFELVKLNTDENPRLAQQYRIQGIPAVKAFRDGQVVSEFTGALPEPQVRAWLGKLTPSQADRLAAEARAAEDRGDLSAAAAGYRSVLARQAGHAAASLGLARVLAAQDQITEAERLLQALPAQPEARALLARLRFRRAAVSSDLPALQARAEANPRDASAHYDLGLALAGDEAYTAALDHLLEAVRLDRAHADDGARKAMLELFMLLGDDDPRTQDYRRRLSSLLF